MLMSYILFGFFIAGLSFYASFAVDDARWSATGARRNGKIIPRNRFTSPRQQRASAPSVQLREAITNWEPAPRDLSSPLEPFDLDPHDLELFQGVSEQFQWGGLTLRELEERLAGDIEALDSESWKHEMT